MDRYYYLFVCFTSLGYQSEVPEGITYFRCKTENQEQWVGKGTKVKERNCTEGDETAEVAESPGWRGCSGQGDIRRKPDNQNRDGTAGTEACPMGTPYPFLHHLQLPQSPPLDTSLFFSTPEILIGE